MAKDKNTKAWKRIEKQAEIGLSIAQLLIEMRDALVEIEIQHAVLMANIKALHADTRVEHQANLIWPDIEHPPFIGGVWSVGDKNIDLAAEQALQHAQDLMHKEGEAEDDLDDAF